MKEPFLTDVKSKNKIYVREKEWIDTDLFNLTIDELIIELNKYKNQGYVGFDVEEGWESTDFYIYRYRSETDEEYEERLERVLMNEEIELKAKEKRRRQFEKLKKEFENDS